LIIVQRKAAEAKAAEAKAAEKKAREEKVADIDSSLKIADAGLVERLKTAPAAPPAQKQSWRIKDRKLQEIAIDHLLETQGATPTSPGKELTNPPSPNPPSPKATSHSPWSKEQRGEALAHARGTYRQSEVQTRALSTRGTGLDLPPHRRHYSAKNLAGIRLSDIGDLDSWTPTGSFSLSPTQENEEESPNDPNRGQDMKIYHYLPMPPNARPINSNQVGCPMYSGAPVGVGARATQKLDRRDRFRLEQSRLLKVPHTVR